MRVALGLLVLGTLAAPAAADEVVLRNGRTLKGTVTETASGVVLVRDGMKMTLQNAEVLSVKRTPTVQQQFAQRLAALPADDADGQFRLGLWAEEKGLADEARARFQAVVAIETDHAGARRALGHIKTDTGWRPHAEVMKERGLVLEGGAWVEPKEAEALRRGDSAALQRRAARDKERLQRRAVNAALRLLASPSARTRVQGERDLMTVAKERGDVDLEARAPEVRAWYDDYYRGVAEARARAVVEVRAQLVTLKRPIPSFQTSLGAFSTPVTLQLPEISVIRINTTALLPLQIDEWD